ncbi:hypothetical protein GCM10011583_14880 [Streptomyces camponoticapitis]|uniref:OmpR/PhoB-type domain-containing protein n=1 Tax=Streptomyces camponoticapitis TaxID=1616125 RepID=A0ABQ2E0M8_9ACTN|nr:AfsR/SARP family transcriptional regulator [Streptomyces camponoticapitis]GGJ84247.1 hypothetical protein GCM10011583_14880 [Streptomyces camponoticapitis]
MENEIEFRVLGVVEVRAGTEWLPLSGKQRSLLAALLLQANRTVTNSRLMDSLWGSPLPVSPETRVRTLVSELRRVFEPKRHNPITTRPSGYMIRIEQGQLDLDTFTSTVARARHERLNSRDEASVELYDQALGLWTGPALGGTTGPNAEAESARLVEMHRSAQEERFDLLLQLRRYAELTADLTPLVLEYPLRERFHGQLMAALHGSGRRSEALDVYMGLRKRLVTELGMEPMPELRQLQQRILAGPADPFDPPAGDLRSVAR